MPEGHHLLSAEERQTLPAEEVRAILTRNTTLLREAVHAMTPEERQAVGLSLEAFGQNHELTQVEKQYVAITEMLLLSAADEKIMREFRDIEQSRFQKLLRDQETASPFPSDPKSVEAEAEKIRALIGKGDQRALYLRTLGPLRARPWNEHIRLRFRRIVRGDSISPQATSLYDAALVFLRARQAESPDQGSWYSLEGFLRLSVRGEVAEAKKLFAAANARGARDVECRIFPLLLAEMDGDAAEVKRARPRALEGWPKSEVLDRVLFESIDELPFELAARARASFGKKYGREHPSDWASRIRALELALQDAEMKKVRGDAAAVPAALGIVESEATLLLALPLTALAEPHRSDVQALQLEARGGLGRCQEVLPALPAFAAEVERAYPREFDPDSPPRPRTLQDARELRSANAEEGGALEKLKAALTDGSLDREPEWRNVPAEQRDKFVRELLVQTERSMAEAASLLRDREDPAVASEWSRRELDAWEAAHNLQSPSLATYDMAGRADRLQIRVRAAEGQCLLAKGMALEAARILKPCVGGGRNVHRQCADPLAEAGLALARDGNLREAAVIFDLINLKSEATDALFEAIDARAPGTVRKKAPFPNSPAPPPGGN
jgi:hypothetical protein